MRPRTAWNRSIEQQARAEITLLCSEIATPCLLSDKTSKKSGSSGGMCFGAQSRTRLRAQSVIGELNPCRSDGTGRDLW